MTKLIKLRQILQELAEPVASSREDEAPKDLNLQNSDGNPLADLDKEDEADRKQPEEDIDPIASTLEDVLAEKGLNDIEVTEEDGVKYYDCAFEGGRTMSIAIYRVAEEETEDSSSYLEITLLFPEDDEQELMLSKKLPDDLLDDEGNVNVDSFPVDWIVASVETNLAECLGEAFRMVVRGGKRIKIKVKRKFTTSGRRIKHRLSPKQKNALRKARFAAKRPAARRHRALSVKVRKRFRLPKLSQRTLRRI